METGVQDSRVISSLTIEPSPERWGGLIASRRIDERSMEFRAQLGLRTDRPVVMSGHQAGFWHSGILAKYVAAQAAADTLGIQAAWIVVDQDDDDAESVRLPLIAEDGRLRAAVWRLRDDQTVGQVPHAPTATLPARRVTFQADALDGAPALDSVVPGLRRIEAAMNHHANGPSLARQTAEATRDLLSELGFSTPVHLIEATSLNRTTLMRSLVDRMLADPARCVQTYNAAVTRHPDAKMARLRTPASGATEGQYELPLWRLKQLAGDAPDVTLGRERVTTASIAQSPLDLLAPRALVMTAMLRLAGCDLFIHGTGGATYDRVTDDWIREWLGETLAPTAMVTATMRLPLPSGAGDLPDAPSALWAAHHAKHDPAMLGDAAAAAEKMRLVGAIRAARARGERPLAEYRAMHALLDDARRRNAEPLRNLTTLASHARASASQAALANDRTWPFPLFPAEDLASLANHIRERFAAATA